MFLSQNFLGAAEQYSDEALAAQMSNNQHMLDEGDDTVNQQNQEIGNQDDILGDINNNQQFSSNHLSNEDIQHKQFEDEYQRNFFELQENGGHAFGDLMANDIAGGSPSIIKQAVSNAPGASFRSEVDMSHQ